MLKSQRIIGSNGVSEMVRQEMIEKLNQFNIFQDHEGHELQGSSYAAIKRVYSIQLIERGIQPGGKLE